MHKLLSAQSFLIIACLAACTPMTPKKVVAFSRGTVEVNTQERTLTLPPSGAGSHDEISFQFYEENNVQLTLEGAVTQGLPASVSIEKDGLTILNLKPADTLMGHLVQYKTAGNQKTRFTQEDLASSVDSLQQLLRQNSTGRFARVLYLKPGEVKYVSASGEAQVIGPFHRLTSMEMRDGKMPEVYRFYTFREIREALARLQQAGRPVPEPE